MNIYIARGDDTLGPYTPGEAVELIKTGYLQSDDLAARNGDVAWVALSSLLLVQAASPNLPDALDVNLAGRRPRRLRLLALMLAVVVAAFLARGVPRSLLPTNPLRSQPSLQWSGPPVLPPVDIAGVKPAVNAPISSPVNKEPVRLSGVIRLVSTEGTPITLATVRVRAYPLRELMPYLGKVKAEVQAELDRLTPLIEAAESEKSFRITAEANARQALIATDPADDLEPSLRFTFDQARAAVKDAENDCGYLRGQRRETSRGEVYFRDLPDAVAMANTNQEGEFTLDLPPGEAFAVEASVPQGARTLYWLVKISTENEGQKPIVLSDDNVASSGSPESLILTKD